MNICRILWRISLCHRGVPISKRMMSYIDVSFVRKIGNRKIVMKWDSIQPYAASAQGSKAACGKIDVDRFWTNFKGELIPQIPKIRLRKMIHSPYPTWTFAGHQSSSYQTYIDVKHTNRKPAIKSTILEGQTLNLSLPGYVYKKDTTFFENLIFSSLAKLHHTSGIKSCASWDGFNAVLDHF